MPTRRGSPYIPNTDSVFFSECRETAESADQAWQHAEPDPATVVADYAFDRPVVTAASARAIAALDEAQGAAHVWCVGAYSRLSMPLLENGVCSAIELARTLGADVDDVAFEPPPPPGTTHRARLLLAAAAAAAAAVIAAAMARRAR